MLILIYSGGKNFWKRCTCNLKFDKLILFLCLYLNYYFIFPMQTKKFTFPIISEIINKKVIKSKSVIKPLQKLKHCHITGNYFRNPKPIRLALMSKRNNTKRVFIAPIISCKNFFK